MKHQLTGMKSSRRGFTIVELMIATSVLSVILLMATVMITSIGNLYYKGINQSRLQDTARNVSNDVSQRLELQAGSTTPPTNTKSYTYGSTSVVVNSICIGTTRYSYVTGWQIGSNGPAGSPKQIPHVLWRDTDTTGACTPLDLTKNTPTGTSPDGTELMVPGGSINVFTVNTASVPYNITIDFAFGDRTLLTGSGLNTTCAGSTGDRFCATSAVSTTATPRTQ
jgi:prepilin-type N-terminal cleavage/methylation domain-containing protein